METRIKPRYLVMVTSANNNKYYKQIPHGNSWTAEYGRVVNLPQKAEYPMNKWESKYREKIRKGYVDQSHLVEDLIQVEECQTQGYRKIEDEAIAEIVERLQNMARRAVSENYTVSSDKVTRAMVDEAQKVLESLMEIKDVVDFNATLLKLYSVIPRRMSEVSSYLSSSPKEFPSIIRREQDMLDVMQGQVVQATLKKEEETSEKNVENTILEAIGLRFEPCSASDVNIIKKALGEDFKRFKHGWRVTNFMTQERFDAYVNAERIKDIRYLWHGSRNENWWSILGSGLVLRPTSAIINGKMFGYGTYYAPMARKSIGYTSLNGSCHAHGSEGSGFLALMSVAYGKPYDVYSFDSKYYRFDYQALQTASGGANSLHAHAGNMPQNDEIIVYKEDQSTIKYHVEIA